MGLYGKGQYNLHSMDEISVTDSFLRFDKNIRNCQNVETYDDCNTRVQLEKLRQECGCLPLSLRLSEKVKWHISIFLGSDRSSGSHLSVCQSDTKLSRLEHSIFIFFFMICFMMTLWWLQDDSKHSESTQKALRRHSEGTQKALRRYSEGIQRIFKEH